MGMGIIQNLYTHTVKYNLYLGNLLKFMYLIDNLSILHETFLNIKILRVMYCSKTKTLTTYTQISHKISAFNLFWKMVTLQIFGYLFDSSEQIVI